VPPLGLKEIIIKKRMSFSPEFVRSLIKHISIVDLAANPLFSINACVLPAGMKPIR
jgi:hypothetical protein